MHGGVEEAEGFIGSEGPRSLHPTEKMTMARSVEAKRWATAAATVG